MFGGWRGGECDCSFLAQRKTPIREGEVEVGGLGSTIKRVVGPARNNSGGNWVTSFAVVTTNTGAVFSCIQESNEPRTRTLAVTTTMSGCRLALTKQTSPPPTK